MSYELSGNLPPDAAIDSTGNFTCTLTMSDLFKVYDFDVKATDSAGQIDLRHVIVDAHVVYPYPQYYGPPEFLRSQPAAWSNEPWTVTVNSTDNALWVGSEGLGGYYPGLTPWSGVLTDRRGADARHACGGFGQRLCPLHAQRGFPRAGFVHVQLVVRHERRVRQSARPPADHQHGTFSIQVGNWVDLLPATTYDNDVHKSILGVGQSETTTLVLQNPRGDGVPAFGFWALDFDRSLIHVYDADGKEIVPSDFGIYFGSTRLQTVAGQDSGHADGRRRRRRRCRSHRLMERLVRQRRQFGLYAVALDNEPEQSRLPCSGQTLTPTRTTTGG